MDAISLSNEEARVLREVIQSSLSDLHTEISHTDDHDYKVGLKEKLALLQAIATRLEG